MPAKLLAKIGMSQTQAYGIHMFMYGSPLLMYLQAPVFIWDESPFHFFQTRVFNDYDFLAGLLMAVLLDTLAGGIRAFNEFETLDGALVLDSKEKKIRKFSGRVFYEKMGKKLFGITVAVLCLGILQNTKIAGEQDFISGLASSGFYSVMLGFEIASVLKNAYGVYPWEPIKIALNKLDIFINRKTGEVE